VNGLSYLNLEGVDKAKYAIHLLKELGIPFLLIADKDFFVPYLEGEHDQSIGVSGFPVYKEEFKDEELVRQLIGDANERSKILNCVNNNHTEMLNILEPHGVISMRYSLDLDLVAIEKAREKYYHLLEISDADRVPSELTKKEERSKRSQESLKFLSTLRQKTGLIRSQGLERY
jgi:hypothetical protein